MRQNQSDSNILEVSLYSTSLVNSASQIERSNTHWETYKACVRVLTVPVPRRSVIINELPMDFCDAKTTSTAK